MLPENKRIWLIAVSVISVFSLNGCSFMSDVSHAVGDFNHGLGDAFDNESKRKKGENPEHDLKGNARRSYDYKASSVGQSSSDNLTRRAQKQLIELGYSPGTADGKMGVKTTDAIKAYQRDNSLPETGELDEKTVLSLSI